MRTYLGRLFLFLALVTMLGAQAGIASASDDDDKVQKKLDDLRKQLEELRSKENDLLEQRAALLREKKKRDAEVQKAAAERTQKEEAERKLKEEAEIKKHYAKVEIRGRLTKSLSGKLNGQTQPTWQVTISGLAWTLHFGDKKDLLAFAEKNVGKGVHITGAVVGKKVTDLRQYPFPIWPNHNPSWPTPNPGWPYNPGLHPMPPPMLNVTTQVIINVESLKLATD